MDTAFYRSILMDLIVMYVIDVYNCLILYFADRSGSDIISSLLVFYLYSLIEECFLLIV